MKGNTAEQMEAALVESIIESACESRQAKEVSRTYDVDESGSLTVNVTVKQASPIDHIVINLNV